MDLIEKAIQEELKGAILKTIAFFDIFDHPLTLMEIKKYLYWPERAGSEFLTYSSISAILHCTKILNSRKIVDFKDGFYYLSGREAIVEERLRRFSHSGDKIKKAKKVIKIFKLVPWIRMAGVGNIIGSHNLKLEGDIDFFVIVRPGKIWTTRLLLNLVTMALNLRPKKEDVKDKICLSFFAAENCLDLNKYFIENDMYFYYWMAGLVPLYERGGAYLKLIKSNGWIKKTIPNWQPIELHEERRVELGLAGMVIGKLIGGMLFWAEPFSRGIQRKMFPLGIREKLNMGSEVVANDSLIKLHVNDRRRIYQMEWKRTVERLNNGYRI
ncbi:MAG: hypothetical protein WCW77_04645 [Patescibacteria group bacterium]|jgi:hypothetical protein